MGGPGAVRRITRARWAFAWDAENLYVGVVVTDDTHQNPGDGWNGDSIQMVFSNAAQDTVTHLYNYAIERR